MTTRKSSAKTVKSSAKNGAAKFEGRKVKANAGQENHFYKTFPRFSAFELLLKAPKRTLKVSTWLDKIESLDNVRDRKQARGIVAKIVNKPGDDGNRNGQVAHFV